MLLRLSKGRGTLSEIGRVAKALKAAEMMKEYGKAQNLVPDGGRCVLTLGLIFLAPKGIRFLKSCESGGRTTAYSGR
jgi:hypothetical protein